MVSPKKTTLIVVPLIKMSYPYGFRFLFHKQLANPVSIMYNKKVGLNGSLGETEPDLTTYYLIGEESC